MRIRKGDAARIAIFMSDETDNEAGETGLAPAVQISKNGGTFAATTNSAVEVASGFYYVELTAAETNTAGPLILLAAGTGSNEWREIHEVYDTVLLDVEIERLVDILARRSLASIEASANGDTLGVASLLGAALATLNITTNGNLAEIRKTDASILGTLDITTDAGGSWTGKTL
ncbi:MAG: hypothetical protein AAF702_44410 [Chloroflexota bacterium]